MEIQRVPAGSNAMARTGFDRVGADRPRAHLRCRASCLEYDMLTWRKVVLPHEPRHGDMLIYPNTAGYQMDKNESQFHDLPLPRRLC
ncbi:diaminopimelate decarboxylase domain protein [Mycobacterium xenopi 3993]|nr:diaminopimelate decarboxylase domain protein [Mycobacterium xenopi 3993]